MVEIARNPGGIMVFYLMYNTYHVVFQKCKTVSPVVMKKWISDILFDVVASFLPLLSPLAVPSRSIFINGR